MSTRSRPIEFLIVGGGPAGSAAALALAERGREVLVVERSDYRAARIGETLPPAANPVLSRLGLGSGPAVFAHLECPGIVSLWGSDTPHINDAFFDPDGNGLHVDRASFDAALARRAEDAGATVLTRAEVRSCHRANVRWEITIDLGEESRRLVATTVIDAAGRRTWPGRPSRRRAFDRQVALVGVFASDGGSAQADRRTWIEAAPSGWWYSAALPGDRLVAAYFTDSDLLDAPSERRTRCWEALLEAVPWTRDRLRSARAFGSLRVVAASSTISLPIAGPGYVAVGDAASTIDPLSSQGILHALTSGLDAAQALACAEPGRAVALYARTIANRFRDDLFTRRQFCRAETRWPDSEFWHRRAGLAPATHTPNRPV
jgi:flavin-dependent dehydrogenase